MLGIRPSTFYRWYERYRAGGPEALQDKPSRPDRVWNRIPDEVRQRIIVMALDVPELSEAEIGAITGHTLRDVRSILDANYLHRDPALAENAIRKLERGTTSQTELQTDPECSKPEGLKRQ
jgi:hypothetical protein